MSRILFLAAMFLLLSACGSKAPSTALTAPPPATDTLRPKINGPVVMIRPGEITSQQVAADTSQTYILYSPASCRSVDSALVIVFFDPHGNGRLPVAKYQKLADRFGVVLVGSNSSKNGLDISVTSQFANNIINDLTKFFDYRATNISLAGFSGGAKVALYTGANNSNITNIIYSGASTQIDPSHTVHLLGFAGVEDMNYTDLLDFARANPGTPLVEFPGKHDWPDTTTFRQAFYWLSFQSCRLTANNLDATLMTRFKKETDRSIASLEKRNAMLDAYQVSSNAFTFLNGISDVSVYKAKMESLAANPIFKNQQQAKDQLIAKEGAEKKVLLAAIQKESGEWWARTIAHYRASSSPSDKRLLGFISLMCYSYSNQLLVQHNINNASFILSIYELADPDNPDQLYFHSVLAAMQNDADGAISYLAKAIKNGFNDRQKMEAEQAFTPLQGNERFSHLEQSLK